MDKNNSRIEKLLVMILLDSIKNKTVSEKARQLNIAGFSNIEIANLLESKPNVITQMLYNNRKSSKKK